MMNAGREVMRARRWLFVPQQGGLLRRALGRPGRGLASCRLCSLACLWTSERRKKA